MSEAVPADSELAPERDTESAAVDVKLGVFLRERREMLGLSQAEVAAQLKVPARKIEAHETEAWSALPERPYLRGMLRNVAKVLNLDAADLTRRYESQTGGEQVVADFVPMQSLHTPFPQRSATSADARTGKRMIAATAVIAIIAVGIWWSGTDTFARVRSVTARLLPQDKPEVIATAGTVATTNPSSVLDSGNPVQSQSESQRESGAESISQPGTLETASPVPSAPESATSGVLPTQAAPAVSSVSVAVGGSPSRDGAPSPANPANTPTVAGAAPVLATSGVVQMRFSEDSWVEVRQADGKILFSELGKGGAERFVDGAPPLEMVIGNAAGVNLKFKGRAVDLVPYTHDRVARLTLK